MNVIDDAADAALFDAGQTVAPHMAPLDLREFVQVCVFICVCAQYVCVHAHVSCSTQGSSENLCMFM